MDPLINNPVKYDKPFLDSETENWKKLVDNIQLYYIVFILVVIVSSSYIILVLLILIWYPVWPFGIRVDR